MLKILSTVTLVLMLILLPPSVLMYASNNAVPGQTMYPVKRWLESGIFAIASLTPTTKAYFSISQTEWRFNETAILLSSGMDASGSLTDLVDQTELTAANINNISSTEEKYQLISKLSNSIDHYQVALQTAAVSDTAVNYQPFPKATPKSAYQLIKQNQPKVSPKAPTIKPAPSSSPVTQPNQPAPSPVAADNSQLQAILEAQKKLEELKKQLEQSQKQLQNQLQTQRTNVAVSPSPKATPSLSVSPQPTYIPSPITTNSQDLYQSNFSPIPTPKVSITKEPSPTPSPSEKSNRRRSSSNSNSDHED